MRTFERRRVETDLRGAPTRYTFQGVQFPRFHGPEGREPALVLTAREARAYNVVRVATLPLHF